MSWKIHKALGYGLTGLAVENGRLVDERINLDAAGLTWHEEDELGRWSHSEWAKYLEGRPNDDTGMMLVLARNFIHRNPNNNASLTRNIIYSNEGGDPGTLLIIPPGLYEQNYRFNSKIDRYESVFRQGESMKYTVDLLPTGIAPWDGWMMKSTGKKLDGTCHDLLEWIYAEASGEEIPKGYAALAKYLELDVSPVEMESMITPEIPDAIKIFAEWLRMFRDPNIYKDIRPMIYTYWA